MPYMLEDGDQRQLFLLARLFQKELGKLNSLILVFEHPVLHEFLPDHTQGRP